MPHLNPLPYFSAYTTTWVLFLLILPKKFHSFPYLPKPSPHHACHPCHPWSWPWQ